MGGMEERKRRRTLRKTIMLRHAHAYRVYTCICIFYAVTCCLDHRNIIAKTVVWHSPASVLGFHLVPHPLQTLHLTLVFSISGSNRNHWSTNICHSWRNLALACPVEPHKVNSTVTTQYYFRAILRLLCLGGTGKPYTALSRLLDQSCRECHIAHQLSLEGVSRRTKNVQSRPDSLLWPRGDLITWLYWQISNIHDDTSLTCHVIRSHLSPVHQGQTKSRPIAFLSAGTRKSQMV